jgi:hypothetical protein
MTSPCELISKQIGELYRCADMGEYVRISTPYLYPDGDAVDVYFKPANGGLASVTDLGESLQWLGMQTVTDRRTPKQLRLIQDICETLGLIFDRGMLRMEVPSPEHDLAERLTRLLQGIIRVADLWFTFRVRAFESVEDEVEEFLIERKVPYQRGTKMVGASHRQWTISFHTKMPRQESLVYVLSTGSRAAARSVAEHVTATWYDLRNLRLAAEPPAFISLFDDTSDVWTPEDFKLVEPLSDVALWSKPEAFADKLAAAA